MSPLVTTEDGHASSAFRPEDADIAAWTVDPAIISVGSDIALVSGRMFLARVPVSGPRTLTKLYAAVTTGGTGTVRRLGLYDEAGVLHMNATYANGIQVVAATATGTYEVPSGRHYVWLGVLEQGTLTMSRLAAQQAFSVAAVNLNRRRAIFIDGGYTELPAAVDLATAGTNTVGIPWLACS